MDTQDQIRILANAARYDASCSSSGSKRESQGGVGNTSAAGICHSWSDDGRCISLLKILLTNACRYDCAYCANRRTNPVERAAFTPEQLVRLTMDFYERNYIEGLFLSSAIPVSPDDTMERMLAVVKTLRKRERFGGYIHLKAIPGADLALVREAGLYVDRMSVNIELPSEVSLLRLAPEKTKQDILRPMSFIGKTILENRGERQGGFRPPSFVPAGQSTQLIVGASPETDHQILRLSEGLYRSFGLKRVYYSAYVPVNEDSRLPALRVPPLLREHRLYQADWLVRLYGFKAGEILADPEDNLDVELDPKSAWALRHPEAFPVEVNRDPYEKLLRVPGVGLTSAKRIVDARRLGPLGFGDLKRIGIVMRRARYFLTCAGHYLKGLGLPAPQVRRLLLAAPGAGEPGSPMQMELFDARTS